MKRALLLLALAGIAGCNPQPPKNASATATPAQAPTGAPPIDITGKGTSANPVRISAQNGNRRVYQVRASSYKSHSAQNTAQAKFNQPTVTFYAKDGTTMTATSPTASVQGKLVVLSGGVHARTSTGLTLTCDKLTYSQNSETIAGDGNVRITGMQGGQRQMLTGSHFTSDVKLTNMVIQ